MLLLQKRCYDAGRLHQINPTWPTPQPGPQRILNRAVAIGTVYLNCKLQCPIGDLIAFVDEVLLALRKVSYLSRLMKSTSVRMTT